MGLELTDNESHTPVIRGRLENNTYTHMYRLQPLYGPVTMFSLNVSVV